MDSINDGAKNLLKETIIILSKFNDLEYIIIGGWCPYLRNKIPSIKHPGTLDVDILFRDGYHSGGLEKVIEAFIEGGFTPSAKHKFQLLKKQTIVDREFIFNIDLLHPKMIENSQGMFVDHLDLDIPINEDEEEKVKIMSIVLPNSALLFDENLFNKYSLEDLEFNLVDFTGMFLTKMESCRKQKRERDSFDIYLAFLNNEIDIKKIKDIAKTNEHIKIALESFIKYLQDKKETFEQNIGYFFKDLDEYPSEKILKILND